MNLKKALVSGLITLSLVVGGSVVAAEEQVEFVAPGFDVNADYPATVDFGFLPNVEGQVSARSFSIAATASSAITIDPTYLSGLGNVWEVWAEAKTVSKSKLYAATAQPSLYKKVNGSWSIVAIGNIDRGSAFWDFDKTAYSEISVYHPQGTAAEFRATGAHSVAYSGSIYWAYTDWVRTIGTNG